MDDSLIDTLRELSKCTRGSWSISEPFEVDDNHQQPIQVAIVQYGKSEDGRVGHHRFVRYCELGQLERTVAQLIADVRQAITKTSEAGW